VKVGTGVGGCSVGVNVGDGVRVGVCVGDDGIGVLVEGTSEGVIEAKVAVMIDDVVFWLEELVGALPGLQEDMINPEVSKKKTTRDQVIMTGRRTFSHSDDDYSAL
jgi:hypothetical protein